MPIYEYQCPDCGVVEVMQGINEEPLKKCPLCRRRKVKKLISESAFHLKGSGWYVTDYARADKDNGKDKKDQPEKKDAGPKKEGAAKKEGAEASAKPAPEKASPEKSGKSEGASASKNE